MTTFRSTQNYLTHLIILVNNSSLVGGEPIQLVPNPTDRRGRGTVFANPLRFKDGATLRFSEAIIIINGELERLEYSYKYEREDLFFRYDRDPTGAKSIKHEECHLHVNGLLDSNKDELRFMTHATSFREVFEFVVACFYQSNL